MKRHTPSWIWPGVLWPGLAAALCALVGLVLPDDASWGVFGAIGLLTLGRALMLLYVPWALVAMVWHRRFVVPGLVGAVGFFLAGVPGVVDQQVGGVRVAFANVLYKGDTGELGDELAALRPDVLVTLERDLTEVPGLVPVASNRDQVDVAWKVTSVFCPEGACEAVVELHGTSRCAMPIAVVQHVSGVCAIGLHAPPAGPPGCPEAREPYVQAVASRVDEGRLREAWGPCEAGAPVLVGGDLNAVAGQDLYQTLQQAGLQDPLLPAGVWARTYPTGGKGHYDLPLVRIDHALVGDLEVDGVRLISLPDTDHKAVLAGVHPPAVPWSAAR